MQITAAQMDVFQQAAERRFIARLCSHLREAHADATAQESDERLAERTRIGVARARRHGMRREKTIALFVGLMFEFGPTFDEHPLASPVLSNEPLRPERRIDLLLQRLSDEDWAEIEDARDDAAWRP